MSKLRNVYINGRFLCQNKTGVQKFALGLTQVLAKKHPEILIIAPKGNYYTYGLKIKKIGFGIGILWEQICLPVYLIFTQKPLLINFCNSAPLIIKRQIVTIHDLAFLKNDEWFSKKFRVWYNFLIPRLCKRSLRILTVSQFVKDEIISEYLVSESKIEIVNNSVPEITVGQIKPLPFRYLLLTGIYNKRKNAEFVISLLPELKKMELHIVGIGSDDNIYGSSQFDNDENLHLFKYVEEEQYYSILRNAEALVFPSKYEGFGIPLLEALSIGTPVIASNISVFRESFGDLPVYFELGNEKSFFEALQKLKIHKPSLNDLSNLKNKFNFDKSTNKLVELIKRFNN